MENDSQHRWLHHNFPFTKIRTFSLRLAPNFAALLVIVCVTLAMTNSHAKSPRTEIATFAGGCFWCMQPPYDSIKGVISTTVGYTGGTLPNPTYEQVSAGKTGHAESIQIVFDPEQISYANLLDVFWKNIDPLALNRQFCDGGTQYRSAIFYHSVNQKKLAEESRYKLEKQRGWRIVTEIVPSGPFYPAEDYHQSYYRKNPIRYKFYRNGCGRDKRLRELWGESNH